MVAQAQRQWRAKSVLRELSMREVAPGDLIFSFMDTRILALGIAGDMCLLGDKTKK